ncbi:MAG TPA: DUF4293 domain-containing protein [Chitinophagales bacterium]|nr:DUF4293 domain-containing protein [Chitinophagales bacterium]
MIQRIQSVYLLLSSISLLLILMIPIGYQQTESGVVAVVEMMQNLPTLILSVLSGVVSFITIFLFNNRKLQLKINAFLIFLILLVIGSIALYQFLLGAEFITAPNYIPYAMSGFALIFSILSYRGISADDKLVRSMDRLR